MAGWQWAAVVFFIWVVLVIIAVALVHGGHGPGRGKRRNMLP
jgi:hypothetical protein